MTNFDKSTTMLPQTTYLLTWNPEHYQNGGNAGVTEGLEEQWTSLSTQPQPGDRVYLIRLGVHPKGIVAKGTVTGGSYEDTDWRDPDKTRRYIRFLAEETRPNCESGLLPLVLLEKLSQGSFKWSSQSSGIVIPPTLASQLENAWEDGRGQHSLAQCARWYQAQPGWDNGVWKRQYRARADILTAIKAGQQPMDDVVLDWLWREGNNSICNVSPGFLPLAEYQRSIDLLRELAMLIMSDPGPDTYKQAFTRWKEAQGKGLFRQCYTAVIHRVFAAVAPERYTTLVKIDHCCELLERFAYDFELKMTKSRDWIELNRSIKAAMAQAGLSQDDPIDNNILAWNLFETFTKKLYKADENDEPAATIFTTEPANEDPVMNEIPLNQILFGPPGTGKTYHTINKALEILDPASLAKNGNGSKTARKALKERFDELVKDGSIDFVTFHQSFSYEDFVEGIRAESDEASGQLSYSVTDGVFKQMCYPEFSIQSPSNEGKRERIQRVIYFRFGAKGEYEEEIVSAINNKRIQFDGQNILPGDLVLLAEGTQLLRAVGLIVDTNTTEEGNLSGRLASNLHWLKILEPSISIEEIVPKPSDVRRSYVLRPERVNIEALQRLISEPDAIDRSFETPKPKVLIIDEINRGNVSRIFGELITLIEPSKRAGAPEALSTTLPYSKRPFSVPDNLYLIGTMNTADRSLAGLDIALRRRFVFKEMAPRPDLLAGVEIEANGVSVDVGELLKVINQRIEVLLDRDYCLGHAYFMSLKGEEKPTLAQLGAIFQHQILPLLQEYFFEDWQRIAWVLNDHRKSSKEAMFLHAPAIDVSVLLGDIPVSNQRQRWILNEEAFNCIDAYALTIKGDKDSK